MLRGLVALALLLPVLASCDGRDQASVPLNSPETATTRSPSTSEMGPASGTVLSSLAQRTGTARGPSAPPVGIQMFYGRVINVDFDLVWSIEPADVAVTPGAVAGTTVGPASLLFEDGRRLEVPARTPGGNACIELVRRQDWEAITGLENPTLQQVRLNDIPYDCLIYGALTADGTIAWFDVAEYRRGDLAATLLRRPTGLVDGMMVVEGGIGFRIATDVQILCQDVTTIEEYPLDLANRAPRTRVAIAIDTGEVTTISCWADL